MMRANKRVPWGRVRERKKQETRRALLEAAAAIAGEVGIDATRIQDVAERAGVGFGTVHNYFGSKDGLVVALLQAATDEALAQGERVLRRPPSQAPAAVTRLFLTHFKVIRQHFARDVLRQIFASALKLPAADRARFMSFDVALCGQLGQLLERPLLAAALTEGTNPGEAAGLLYGVFSVELLLYLSVPEVTARAFETAVERKVHLVFSGLSRSTR